MSNFLFNTMSIINNIRKLYKVCILVGKQQYIIVKPLNLAMLMLSVYVLLFQLTEFGWLILVLCITLGTLLILLEKPKLSFIFHLFVCLWFVLLVLQNYGKIPPLSFLDQQLNLRYDSLPYAAGIIFLLAIFAFIFDISLMENVKNMLSCEEINKIEKEKIIEYLKKEKI